MYFIFLLLTTKFMRKRNRETLNGFVFSSLCDYIRYLVQDHYQSFRTMLAGSCVRGVSRDRYSGVMASLCPLPGPNLKDDIKGPT